MVIAGPRLGLGLLPRALAKHRRCYTLPSGCYCIDVPLTVPHRHSWSEASLRFQAEGRANCSIDYLPSLPFTGLEAQCQLFSLSLPQFPH